MTAGTKRDLALRGSYAVHSGLPLDDLVMGRMRLFDTDAYCWVEADREELERRERVGLEPITGYGVLRLLSSLPLREPVPLAELPDYEQRLARRLPDGAVLIEGGFIVRLMRPALSVRMAVVVDHDVERGLGRSTRFAHFSARMLVCTAEDIPAAASVEAMFYGVGLVGAGPDAAMQALVDPEPEDAPFDPVVWQFQEEAAERFARAAERRIAAP